MVVSVLTCWRNDRRESIKLNNHIVFFFSWGSQYPFQQEAEPSKDMPAREFSPRTFRKLLIRWNLRISQTSETNVSQNDVWSSSSSCYLPRVLLFFPRLFHTKVRIKQRLRNMWSVLKTRSTFAPSSLQPTLWHLSEMKLFYRVQVEQMTGQWKGLVSLCSKVRTVWEWSLICHTLESKNKFRDALYVEGALHDNWSLWKEKFLLGASRLNVIKQKLSQQASGERKISHEINNKTTTTTWLTKIA